MKRTIALSFALSTLAATSVFASTSTTQTFASQTAQVAQSSLVGTQEVSVAGAGNKTFDRADVNVSKKVVVAENRKEFGSQYQRY
jgi:hypothetical protein